MQLNKVETWSDRLRSHVTKLAIFRVIFVTGSVQAQRSNVGGTDASEVAYCSLVGIEMFQISMISWIVIMATGKP